MKKIIRIKNIEICVALAFILLSLSLANFALADNSSSTEDSKLKGGFDRDFDQNKNKERADMEEEMIRKIFEKRSEIEQKMMEMKDMRDRLDGELKARMSRFGTSTYATSTFGFNIKTSSSTPFRKREAEIIDRESKKIANRFDASLNRLNDSYERVLEKVKKFEQKGVLTAETKKLLDASKLKIDVAQSDVDALIEAVNNGMGNMSRKDYLANLKNLSLKAKDSIKMAQSALSDAVSSLKPGYNKDKQRSSSSAINNVSSATSSAPISSSSSSSATSSSASSSI